MPAISIYRRYRRTIAQSRRTTNDYLIPPQQMGRVRLGMTVGQLKRMFPKATYRLVRMEDIPSAVVMVSQGSEILFYFVSSADTAKPPADKDTINFMMTKNPRYATAAGIRPSSVSIWG
ncbi:MAG: hypothetical protein AB1861_21145, partial [Cyanobacteriota bacterium]